MSEALDRITELTIQWAVAPTPQIMKELIALKFTTMKTEGITAVEEAFKKGQIAGTEIQIKNFPHY